MSEQEIKVGDMVQTGVYVLGEWRPSYTGRVVQQSSDGVPIYECGAEPCFLAHAWTDDGRPVMVFVGSCSKAHFVPETDDMAATDWIVVEP